MAMLFERLAVNTWKKPLLPWLRGILLLLRIISMISYK